MTFLIVIKREHCILFYPPIRFPLGRSALRICIVGIYLLHLFNIAQPLSSMYRYKHTHTPAPTSTIQPRISCVAGPSYPSFLSRSTTVDRGKCAAFSFVRCQFKLVFSFSSSSRELRDSRAASTSLIVHFFF